MLDPLALDAQDELADFRNRFVIDDPKVLYLDGNSLGRLPKDTRTRLQQTMDQQWGRDLIGSWNADWMSLAGRVGNKIATLIGATAGEVVVSDSTSVNLFKLAVAALHRQSPRSVIVTDDLNFPSDIYVLQAAADGLGGAERLRMVPSRDGQSVDLQALQAAIDQDTALVSLSHTAFKSGSVYPMHQITQMAHDAGALMLWDLSHSVGAVPVQLNACQADLAVGCTYKYLNGGPGAPAFLFVRRDLQARLQNPIRGWFGQQRPFDFDLRYEPMPGVERFLCGTPPILSLAAVETGVDLVLDAGMDRIRRKSVAQTQYLVQLWQQHLASLGYRLQSPSDPDHRGAHVSLGHDEGWRIDRALIERYRVIPDFRRPDNIRMGLSPLYTSFEEIHRAVRALADVVESGAYRDYDNVIDEVT